MATSYRIVTVDGHEAAETLLNDTVGPNTELVQSHILTVHEEPAGEQENIMLGGVVTRYIFIFKTD